MTSNGLLAYYRTLCPGATAVYITPNIHRMAQNDPYPYALYREVLEAGRNGELRIDTRKILSPLILWRRLLGEKSIVHHHFFEIRDLPSFCNVLWKTVLLTLYRMAGGTIVWTIHNRYPHDMRMAVLIRPLRKYIARVSTALHVHCREAVHIMGEVLNLPPERFMVVPHPLYDAVLMPQAEARATLADAYPELRLPADRPWVLMLGALARYKGIDGVLEITGALPEPPVLIVAGGVKQGNARYAETLHHMAGSQPLTRLLATRIPAEHMPLFYNAADYVLFNYTDILTSGGAAWAMSYRKPVLVPRKGCLRELAGPNVVAFDGREELRALLASLKKPAGER